jgi:methylenetetrahydrofolate reductase (NADPH)
VTKIAGLIEQAPTVSFEFFPPKTDEGRRQLAQCIDELAAIDPHFVSVTYGAGGTTRDDTRDVVVAIDRDQTFPAMPHLTCIGHARSELSALLADYRSAGIDNVLALAGDPPADGSPAVGDFTYASELVELVRESGDFCVAVAAFPEGHPRSASLADDRRRLAAKLEVADFGITQFFFDSADYLRMRDDLARLGCDAPVLPGIMPLLNPTAIRRFATMNGASFPEDLAAAVAEADPSDGVRIATDAARAKLEAAASLGAAPWDAFVSVALPLSLRAYLTAGVLTFAHTMGEFGVVLMVGGNIPGQTRVISVALYEAVEGLDYGAAHRLAGLLLVLSFAVLLGLYALNGRTRRGRAL